MVLAAAEGAGRPLSYFFYMREASDLVVSGEKTRRGEIDLSHKIEQNVPRVN